VCGERAFRVVPLDDAGRYVSTEKRDTVTLKEEA